MTEPVSRKQRFPLPNAAAAISQARERRQAVLERFHPSTERLPSERCPHCGSERRPTALDSGLGVVRAYRCLDCRRQWSVQGRQETLFDLDGQINLDLSA